MIKLIKHTTLLLIFSLVNVSAQTIEEIQITGNSVFSDSELGEWGKVQAGSSYFPGILDSVNSRIVSRLALNGYLHSSIEKSQLEFSPDSQKVRIHFAITEGNPTVVKNLFISGKDSLIEEQYFPLFRYLEGEVINKYEIENIINQMLSELENEGYPFASVTIQSIYLYDDSTGEDHFADLYLELSEGKKSTIDRIEVEGNSSTKDYVIVRELRIDFGEEYAQTKVEDLPKRLNKLRFFEPVSVPKFYLDSEDRGVLLINVKEKNTNNFDGIIGYVPPASDNESGYVTGLVNVVLRNIFGTGRAASVRWQKLDRETQELELKYLEPWLFSYPFNINAELFQRIQDTTYVHRRFGGGIEYLATEDISAAAFVSSEEVIPTERDIPVFTVYNSSAITTGLTLKIDLRDDPLAPTEGLLFETSYSFSRKTIDGPAEFITPGLETNIDLQRITAGFNGFYELFLRHIIALGIHGRELTGDFFEESDLWRFGGTRTVRGYREEQFLASRIAWTNLEYRLLLTRRSYAFVFLDSGYYFREADPERQIFKTEDFILGYGLGITVDTAIGLLGVSFALAEGETFSEGKLHFGIINEF